MDIHPKITSNLKYNYSVLKHFLFSSFLFIFIAAQLISVPSVLAQTNSSNQDSSISQFKDQFYMPHETRLKYATYDCLSFILTKQEVDDWNSFFSVVTGFDQSILETRILKDVQTVDEARDYFESNSKRIDYKGASILEVTLKKKDGSDYQMYWVGQKAFSNLEQAQGAVLKIKKILDAKNLNFDDSVEVAENYSQSFTGAEKVAAKEEVGLGEKPNFQNEEEFFFDVIDGLELNKFYGKYPEDEWFLYQAVGEATFRNTNLDNRSFNAVTGFNSNRVVFRGLKFFGSSIDPYVEGIIRFETNSRAFSNSIDWTGGLEYRPFRLNKALEKSPWTEWAKNIRMYLTYTRRDPIKDISFGDRDHDLQVGIDYFKEWGIDLPKEGDDDSFLWGEWFGNYYFSKTGLGSTDDFDSYVLNSAVRMGIKWPRIPLPENPINDELVVMPYFLFEHVNTTGTGFFFQNRYFVGAGVRLMPFRSYRFLNSQWLFKTKLFFEYEGVGSTQYSKRNPPSSVPDRDYRLGINVSLNRF